MGTPIDCADIRRTGILIIALGVVQTGFVSLGGLATGVGGARISCDRHDRHVLGQTAITGIAILLTITEEVVLTNAVVHLMQDLVQDLAATINRTGHPIVHNRC